MLNVINLMVVMCLNNDGMVISPKEVNCATESLKMNNACGIDETAVS